MSTYIKRSIETVITNALKTSGAVLIRGPKFCGKTTTASRFAKSIIRLNTSEAINRASLQVRDVLIGNHPRLIDEWQTVPDIWNAVKEDLDIEYEFGKYILAGSSTPEDKKNIHHSGAGRITSIMMRTMSLYESGDSSGEISLKDLFDNNFVCKDNKENSLEEIAHLICRGGWPLSVSADKDIAIDITKNYYNGLFNFEYSENEKFRNKKPETMRAVLKSYARNISTEATITKIISDVVTSKNRLIDPKTVNEYIDALNDLYIIEDLEAWNVNLRSRAIIRTTNVRHFVDTSLATSALNISPSDLINDLNTFGLFFEDMVIRDLKIYTDELDGKVFHYRDNNGLESDAIIHLNDGRWAIVEVKLGGEKLIEEAVKNIRKLNEIVDEKNNMSFGLIITANGKIRRIDDNIYVVPIKCLR